MINPLVLFLGTSGFIFAFIIHILIWRTIRPVKHLNWLILIFIILPVTTYLILFFLSFLLCQGRFMSSLSNIIFIILWHIALSGTYIMTYPVLQAECPSFKIMLAVSASMPKGIAQPAINNIFSEDILMTDRIEDLINDGLLYIKDNKCILTFKGNLLALCFAIYRRLLGLPLGEG